MLPKIPTTIFTVIILTLLVCFIFFRSPPDESSPPVSPTCQQFITEICDLNRQFQMSIPSRFMFLFSDEKFTSYRDEYNTVLKYICKRHDIRITADELETTWKSAEEEAARVCLVC